jgi:hypothetical protein
MGSATRVCSRHLNGAGSTRLDTAFGASLSRSLLPGSGLRHEAPRAPRKVCRAAQTERECVPGHPLLQRSFLVRAAAADPFVSCSECVVPQGRVRHTGPPLVHQPDPAPELMPGPSPSFSNTQLVTSCSPSLLAVRAHRPSAGKDMQDAPRTHGRHSPRKFCDGAPSSVLLFPPTRRDKSACADPRSGEARAAALGLGAREDPCRRPMT